MLVLQTNDLTKKYKDKVAVDHVNMHIKKGDIYGFVGENGAGKTTIIRLISGLAAPNSGDYDLFGVNSKDRRISDVKKKMGGIVETVSISTAMTAKENIEVQSILVGKKLTDSDKDNLLMRVGLDPQAIAKKKAGSFSLGMRQRLGIALTLIGDPEFIILDEPMNGLDPKGFIEVRDIIQELNKQGITFLISSHILSELDKICTRIGFISNGKLLKELSIEELRDRSKSRLVIECEDVEGLDKVLTDKFDLKDAKIEGKELHIFDAVDINEIIKEIVDSNIKIENIGRREETIETYYMKLIGGARYE